MPTRLAWTCCIVFALIAVCLAIADRFFYSTLEHKLHDVVRGMTEAEVNRLLGESEGEDEGFRSLRWILNDFDREDEFIRVKRRFWRDRDWRAFVEFDEEGKMVYKEIGFHGN